MVYIMKKEDLMQKFGPKLLDALIQEMAYRFGIDEQTIIDSISNRLVDTQGNDKISDYSWMSNSFFNIKDS